MAYTTAEAREQILEDVAVAVDHLALAAACLGEAYEHLHGASADRLEEDLYRPVQGAYGRTRRTYLQFAERVGLPVETFEPASAGVGSQGVRLFIDRAVSASADAGRALAELQDSMLPIEAGDSELRTALAEIREVVDGVPARAREFMRVLGR